MTDRLKNIKLIVIDIDGTLVNSEGNVGSKTLQLAKELKNHNVLCTLSSARSYNFSCHIADELEIDIPFVTLDGSLIKDRKDRTIYKAVIKRDFVKKAVKVSEENYGKIALCGETNLFITPRNSVVTQYVKLNSPVKEVNDYSETDEILEILIYCEDKTSLNTIKNSFGYFDKRSVSLNVTKSPRNEYYLLTVKKKGSDKLESVKRLVSYLGFKKTQVAVIGGWHNDMPLFDYGAYNIAVQNAIPELKRKADYVTRSTNNEDAVGEVLEIVREQVLNGKQS